MSEPISHAPSSSRQPGALQGWVGERQALLISYGFILVLLVAAGIMSPGFVRPGNLSQQLVLAS